MSGQRRYLHLTNNQEPIVPSSFTGLLSMEENKSPNPGEEKHGYPTTEGFIPAYYFVLVLLRSVFTMVGPKQSNQIAFVSDASQGSHRPRTMAMFLSLCQQCCQCNLWVCCCESRLIAVQLGMLMGFSWGISSWCLAADTNAPPSFCVHYISQINIKLKRRIELWFLGLSCLCVSLHYPEITAW